MYEHFRNKFMCAALEKGIPKESLDITLKALDETSAEFEIKRRETALIPYGEEIPEIVKLYVVCKKIDGLADTTLETYMRVLGIFFRAVRKPAEMVTPNDIRLYLYQYQKERGCSNRSLDKYRGYLYSFFTWATDEGYIPRNPMKTITAIKYEKKPRLNLTQLELEYLRSGCRTVRDHAIVEFLYSTGCRVSELSTVKKSDIDWNARSVHLFGKGKKHRTSYLNAKAEVSLLTYLQSRNDDCEYLFVTERKEYRQLSTAAIEKVIRKIAERTSFKIEKSVTPHVLRHTMATRAVESGMPIEEVKQILGHEKIDTTMIYTHTCVESVRSSHQRHIV